MLCPLLGDDELGRDASSPWAVRTCAWASRIRIFYDFLCLTHVGTMDRAAVQRRSRSPTHCMVKWSAHLRMPTHVRTRQLSSRRLLQPDDLRASRRYSGLELAAKCPKAIHRDFSPRPDLPMVERKQCLDHCIYSKPASLKAPPPH